MLKVKNIWFEEDPNKLGTVTDYATGLVLELEDGTMLKHNTTDSVDTWSPLNHKEDGSECWCNPKVVHVPASK